MREWHFEHVGHFEGVDRKGLRCGACDHGRDFVRSDRHIVWQSADHFNEAIVGAHFFFGLAQRGGDDVGVKFVHAPPRKANLTSVIVQMRGALRKHNV